MNDILKELEDYVIQLNKCYKNGIVCSVAESIIGESITNDILKKIMELKIKRYTPNKTVADDFKEIFINNDNE